VKKGRIGERVKAFIQNVHHFRDEALLDPKAPHEHVAIFDEAQRAWNQKQTASFMQRKKKRSGFNQSEPEFLISYMDRTRIGRWSSAWSAGGQEIHRGEAGIDAWLDAVNSRFPHWDMHISSRLTDTEYAAGRVLDRVRHRPNTHLDDSLHLGVSMRSFRAENVSSFIKALLDCEKQHARDPSPKSPSVTRLFSPEISMMPATGSAPVPVAPNATAWLPPQKLNV
jgi:hypothetical protein